MRVVADTAPLVSFVDRSDRAHRLAVRLVSELGADLMVPDAVVVEAYYLIRARISREVAQAFLEDFRTEALRRIPLSPGLFGRAVEYDRAYADLELGIVDASVMALAEAEKARVLTFDFRDFRATRPLRGGFWPLVVDEERFRRIVRP